MEASRSVQQEKRKQQAQDFEKLNSEFDPPYPLPTSPGAAPVSDDDDSSVDSAGDPIPDLLSPEGAISDSESDDEDDDLLAPEGAKAPNPPTPPPHQPRRSKRLRELREKQHNRNARVKRSSVWEGMHYIRDGAGKMNGERLDKHPDFDRCYTSLVTDRMRNTEFINNNKQRLCCTLGPKQPPRSALLARKKREYKCRLVRKKLKEANSTICSQSWEVPSAEVLLKSDLARFVHFAATDCGFDGTIESLVANWLHPLMLAAKSKRNDADNPSWIQAMNGPFSQEYWEASCLEVETLEKMDAWSVVDRKPEMNVLPSTWAFKCKRFPDGLIKKFKARFCARGNRQIEGVDYFETYALVVMCVTVRLLLIFECLLSLVSKQGDVTCAFLHAHLEEGEEVYLQMPCGFKQYDKKGNAKVLKLKRTLYGLKQSPRAFWKYMVEKLSTCGMKQSDLDPCLFISDTVIIVMYVDDILMWSTNEEHIFKLGDSLRAEGVELEEEDDAAGFLGVNMTK